MRYDSLKPEFVDAATQALAEYIIAGKVTFPADATETQKFLQKSGVTSCKVVSISKPRKDGNRQVVVVVLNNTAMKFSFDLELELTHDAEGNWRITDARGFEDYYYGWRRSLRRKLDSLNAPIANRMDEIFAVKSFKAKVAEGDEYGFSQTIDITITADVKSDKPLAKIIGNIILGKDERESRAPFEIDMSNRPQGVQTFDVTKTLNPFVRADSNAMKHGFRKKDIHIEVTEVIFSDGTNLKQYEQLPDE